MNLNSNEVRILGDSTHESRPGAASAAGRALFTQRDGRFAVEYVELVRDFNTVITSST